MATKKELQDELNKIKESKRKQESRQNRHIKENYKRSSFVIRNEIYSGLQEIYGEKFSMNKYINDLIAADLESHGVVTK